VITLDFKQRSPEWFKARCGTPTASQFSRIVTPTGTRSTQAKAYMAELIAETQCGPLERYSSDYMDRGTELEGEAIDWYEYTTGAKVETVGMCVADDLRVACSPDGLVGDDAGLEIKCLSPANHVLAQLGPEPDKKHRPQIQGCLWITGRKCWDLLYYHPDMAPVLRTQERDENYIATLAGLVWEFREELHVQQERLDKWHA